MIYGSKPTDDRKLLVSRDEYSEVAEDPIASTYLRKFVGAKELIHARDRWCLWLVDAPASDIRKSSVISQRVAAVEQMRLDSSDAATNKAAARPSLFQYNRQPDVDYLAIPRHVGEQRRYFTARRLTPDVICGDANFLAPDVDGFILGVLSSSMFIAWLRAIGGRIKSDLRFSNTFVYNTFPLPSITTEERRAVTAAAKQIVTSRDSHLGMSLADLYEPDRTPADVVAAHATLDNVIDAIFGVDGNINEVARQQLLFTRYAAVIAKSGG